MNFTLIASFTIILLVLTIGEIISMKTKAFVPSVFVSAVLFLVGFWTFFPKDLIARGSFAKPIVYVSMYLILVHMGTLMSLKELLSQWKTVLISLGGILDICLMTLTIGKAFFGWKAVVAGTPPLAGGIVASILMAETAAKKGLPTVALLATCMYIIQGFIGYPISAICLKKEAKRVLIDFKNKKSSSSKSSSIKNKTKKKTYSSFT